IIVRVNEKNAEKVMNSLSVGDYIIATGLLDFDPTIGNGELVLIAKGISKGIPGERTDDSEEKRVELHVHSKYSDLDSVLDIKQYVGTLSKWGHRAAALTDHGNVQGIIEFYKEAKSAGIKPIFGMEGYIVNDVEDIYHGDIDGEIEDQEFVVVDLETTGLDVERSEIIEIGAVKIKNGREVDRFQSLIKPKKGMSKISEKITGISEEMLKDKPTIEKILPDFLKFLGDAVVVAHNANFDYRFLRTWVKKVLGKDLKNPYIDTLSLSRALLTMPSYSLDKVANKLKLGSFTHHRAMDDAEITAKIFIKFLPMLKRLGIKMLKDFNKLKEKMDVKAVKPKHATILVKNKEGLKNLYKLVSLSHIEYFHTLPKIPKSVLNKHRNGLLIGSACMSGEVVDAILDGANDEEVQEIMKFYDFIEIMPLDVYKESMRKRMKEIYKKIYDLAKKLGISVVMTGDVHYLDPEDKKIRMALLAPQKNLETEDSNLYLRTTKEMLDSAMEIFEDEKVAKEIVIENTNKIADIIEEIAPVEGKLHPPIIEGADEEVKTIATKRAREIYGDPLPEIIEKRLDKELKAIIDHGYAVLYLIAKKIVDKAKKDGYVVGSRGSVGSSLVAYLLGITEVNPLPAHYACLKCHYVEFHPEYGSGYDLPSKKCPNCGEEMFRNGQDIPFEVFMGFEGDKVPDIDLNFSGEYQEKAHKFVEKLFGREHVYRAGTISTIAERSARGFVKSFEEKSGITLRKAEFDRLVMGVTGVKRTTGQHPGGLMIVPKDKEVYDFTPIQYPANDKKAGVFTTHFAYEHIHDDIVKLDALGHDDPTFIRHLKDLTGIDPMTIPMNDPDTLKIFSSLEPLGIPPDELGSDVGTLGIPEFGTRFVRNMLMETMPKSFAELVRISGLSHGTDVWANNARDLIEAKVATLSEVISCRDDIMNFLIERGMEPKKAFKIMEKVRKGKGLTDEDIVEMKRVNTPNWFIESCKKIKYLFPKAHAAAYVSMAFRIAYFKVHYPLAFYSVYFSIKGDEFNLDAILGGKERIKSRLAQLRASSDKDIQEKNEETVLEIALEMMLRGYDFLPPDIEKSHATRFLIEGNKLRVPFNKLPGLGDSVAESIVEAREEKVFSSIEDLVKRTKVNKAHIEIMKKYNVLEGLPETSQFSLF
ncbi:MAG: PolC-type DNA polymerase III, partial [Thermotogaceae bacterium]|nr:PolC-type DNA polymerase III [Thermotogaceae bacterium]